MIPYNNKQTGMKEAQIQLSYKSYIQLAIRSGYYKKINALAIKKGELIKYDPLEEEIEVKLIEDEEEREKAPIAGFYATFEYLNGFKKSIYWSSEKMICHADKYSQAFNRKTFDDIQSGKIPAKDMWKYSSPWYSRYEDMGIKTVLKQLLSKYGILSVEMQEAIEKDQAVIKEDGTPVYVDNYNEDYVISDAEVEEETNKEEVKSLNEI
jgi:recombination protein RecT